MKKIVKKMEYVTETSVKLVVKVSAEEWENALDKAFEKVVKEVKVDGFRPGKMPKALFIRRFGWESLYNDALDFVLQESYPKAIEQADIYPVSQPQIDLAVEKLTPTKGFEYKVVVDVIPPVELGEYILGTVDRFLGYRNALGHTTLGLGIPDDNLRTGETFPGMVIVAHQQKLRVLGGAVGGVGGGYQQVVIGIVGTLGVNGVTGNHIDAGMEFGMGQLANGVQQHIVCIKASDHLVLVIIQIAQLGVQAEAIFRRQRVIESAVRGHDAVPAGVGTIGLFQLGHPFTVA